MLEVGKYCTNAFTSLKQNSQPTLVAYKVYFSVNMNERLLQFQAKLKFIEYLEVPAQICVQPWLMWVLSPSCHAQLHLVVLYCRQGCSRCVVLSQTHST